VGSFFGEGVNGLFPLPIPVYSIECVYCSGFFQHVSFGFPFLLASGFAGRVEGTLGDGTVAGLGGA